MPRHDRKSHLHYAQAVNPSGRSRSACGQFSSEVTSEADDVTCAACQRCLESALKRRTPDALVNDIVREIRNGWGDDAVSRGSILTILFERIVNRQFTESGLIPKLIALDREISSRGY